MARGRGRDQHSKNHQKIHDSRIENTGITLFISLGYRERMSVW